jgi:hypothetical protein
VWGVAAGGFDQGSKGGGESGGAAELDPERMARSVPGSSQVGEEVANGGGRRTADGCS